MQRKKPQRESRQAGRRGNLEEIKKPWRRTFPRKCHTLGALTEKEAESCETPTFVSENHPASAVSQHSISQHCIQEQDALKGQGDTSE